MQILELLDKILNTNGENIKKKIIEDINANERCIHRHTIEEHPNCFRRGLIRGKQKDWQWWRADDIRIGFLDIETTSFDANGGFMLSWCIKYNDRDDVIGSLITKEEIFNEKYDKRIVYDLTEELKNLDAISTYYGTRFDIPFMRARALHWGYYFPPYGSVYHMDCYYRTRALLKLHRNSLGAATRFFGIDGKTHPFIDEWMDARYGKKEALDFVWEHNVEDVKILEKLFWKLEPYSKWTKKSI